jgi:hypothetical protein
VHALFQQQPLLPLAFQRSIHRPTLPFQCSVTHLKLRDLRAKLFDGGGCVANREREHRESIERERGELLISCHISSLVRRVLTDLTALLLPLVQEHLSRTGLKIQRPALA